MMKHGLLGSIAVTAALGATSALTHAEFVTFEFAGEVTSIGDRDNLLQGALRVGDSFSGTYTFEQSTPDSQPHPRKGVYIGAIQDMRGTIGNLPFQGPTGLPNAIEVWDGFVSPSSDNYIATAAVNWAGYPLVLGIGLVDSDGLAILNDALSANAPMLTDFEFRGSGVGDPTEHLGLSIGGSLTRLSVVPEPGTLILLTLPLLLGYGFSVRGRMTRTPARFRGGRASLLTVALGSFIVFGVTAGRALATDCNGNGYPDEK